MLTGNPFAEISATISPAIMQIYVVVMFLLVSGGTLFDVLHKKSARYFFSNWATQTRKSGKTITTGEMFNIAAKTACVEVATSAEFCNARRRIAHLLTMYGFLAYIITSAVMIFCYSTPSDQSPGWLPLTWHLGASMVCVGGYWFWFFIRVDVAAEGHSPFKISRADLFILSLLASTTLALIWSLTQASGATTWSILWFTLYIASTTILFGSVPWSKFAHMFFKPAAALQKRVSEADGSRSNLPAPSDKPEKFGSPKRLPQNY